MKTEYMHEFLELSETLNFSVTSGKLFISQSTLTRHIQAMEKELGVKLLVSTSHGVSLTSEGMQVAKTFRHILKEYRHLQSSLDKDSDKWNGSLTIGLLYYAIDDLFSGFLSFLHERYPGLKLNMKSCQPQEIISDLSDGKIDIGSVFFFSRDKLKGLRCQKIASSSFIAVFSEKLPLAKKKTIKLQDLLAYPLVELRSDPYSNEITMELLRQNHVSFHDSVFAENIEMVPLVVRNHDGVHITGEHCKKQNAASVTYRPISGIHSSLSLGFAAREENSNSLIDLFLQEAARYYRN